MGSWSLRDKTCVVGVGTTSYGNFPETDANGLGLEALRRAADDAGIAMSEIDGLIVSRIPGYERFAEMAGLNPRFTMQTPMPGRFASISMMLAANALACGEADVIALVYGNNGRSQRMNYGGGDNTWSPWGMTSPGALHAMMWQRHVHRYGSRSEDLAHVAVAFRKHAMLNPDAVMREALTIEQHQAGRFIAEPLRLNDYCLINDGGVAWIMTTADRAKDLKRKPVYVSGYARQDTFTDSSTFDDELWYPALRQVSNEVHERAGIGRDEIDGLMIYDNFTPTVLFSLEGMGYCQRGEGGAFVRDGRLELGRGSLPTNTSGGHLSESYMQGWALIAEAVRQLRGELGDRQIPDCKALQYICATNCATSLIFRN
jgi:acetyl-CoA acetyltransferase